MAWKGAFIACLILWSVLLAVPSGNAGEDIIAMVLFGDSSLGWGLTATHHRIPGPDISVFVGGKVGISLVSADGSWHSFGVDYNGNGQPDAGEPFSGNFSVTKPFEFDATNPPGTYTYWCYIHPQTMFGRFKVLERGQTTLSISPSQIESSIGSQHTVALSVASVQDLYWYRIRVQFDPSLLQAMTVSLGGTWPEESGIPIAPRPSTPVLNNASGEVEIEVWIQGTFPGFTGSGPLAYVNLIGLSSGRSTIRIDATATELHDSQFREIPYRLAGESPLLLYGVIGGIGVFVVLTAFYLRKRRARGRVSN